jgi:eukaryotic-like serine/threonine-protein kinase
MIGEGGFGQVWRARRDEGGELVAIKILHFELVSSHDALTRFQREIAAIERLRHPNVVRAFQHGTLADGRPFMVMEYLEGSSLREVIRDRGAIPPEELLTILGPICDALTVAHASSLVHRDIKASNVVLARDATGSRPVLLDFGLVKLVDDTGPGLTSSRTMLGTPTAMAPEQMRGEAVDARTDVYALGLLAFHMLTGQPAFTAGGGAIKSYLQLHGPRPRPSSKIDIDPAIDGPIMKALAPTPVERYGSAKELFEALRAVILSRASGSIPIPRVSLAEIQDRTLMTPTPGEMIDVVAFYVEGNRTDVARATQLARSIGMTIAIEAPDSVLAVASRERCDVDAIRSGLGEMSTETRIAVGPSTASIQDGGVDGPALDVESWAPYPLGAGVWINPSI